MPRPSQGYLVHNQNNWQFRPGYKNNNATIDLPNFNATFQLLPGHQTFNRVHQAQSSYLLSRIVARHVSAKSLQLKDAPTLPQHAKMSPNDKDIWDSAYAEEYHLPAWITITEREYQQSKHKYGTLLPTMAISTVKYDEMGLPKRAKYIIVALGNLDPHDWSKAD